jgi:hypothetical protein
LVPVSAYALGSQLDLLIIFSHELAEPKVSDFDLSLVENDILGL